MRFKVQTGVFFPEKTVSLQVVQGTGAPKSASPGNKTYRKRHKVNLIWFRL